MKSNLFLFFIFSLFSAQVVGIEQATPSCLNTQVGSWFHLKTVTSFELTKDCQFKFHGPNCDSSGVVSSPIEEQGESIFKTENIKTGSSCPFHGEKSCKYIILRKELLLSCGDSASESYVKEKENIDLKRLKEDAANEDESARRALAIFYLRTQQAKKAEPLLLAMAKAKDSAAISALGLVKFYGVNGFKKNISKSLKWNRLAAENGSAEAKYILGNHYFNGLGVKKSYPTARAWYQKAAIENNIPAQKALAKMWNEAIEGFIEKYDAQYWLQQAIALGDTEAAYLLAHLDDEPVRVIASEEKPKQTTEPASIAPAPAAPTAEEKKEIVSQEFVTVESGNRYIEGLFLIKPYFLFQERQGAVPSVAVGITPGLQMGQLSLKMQASVSLLNMALGDTFAAFDVGTVLSIKFDNLFFEAGYGFDFWPEPGGTAQSISVSAGTVLTKELFGIFPVKTVSLGVSQSFFEDRTFKIFAATTF